MNAHEPVLKTRRLELRPCTRESTAELHAVWTAPEMRQFLFDGRQITRAEADAFIDTSISNFVRFGYGLWLVAEKSAKELVGFVGLLSPVHGTPNLVYGVCREFCGRGYVSEAAFTVLHHCFDTLHLPRIRADVDAPNSASIRVLEKLGMSRVGCGTINGRPLLYFAVDETAWRPYASGIPGRGRSDGWNARDT